MYIYITRAGKDVIPARQLARMSVSLARRHLERARHHRATALERRAQALQLTWLEVELELKILDVRRACGGQVVEQAIPIRIRRAHPFDLGTADRVEQRRGLIRDQQVLAAVYGDDEVTAVGQFAEPRPLRPWPFAEPAA